MELDELRKRLFTDRQSRNGGKPIAAVSIFEVKGNEQEAETEVKPEPRPLQPTVPQVTETKLQLKGSVDGFFEISRKFRDSMSDLNSVLLPLESASHRAAETFETIRSLHDQLRRLADTFQSVKDFTEEVRQVGQKFEPMNALHAQLSAMADAFSMQITDLAGSFETAKDFHVRIGKIAAAFEPICSLESGLIDLAQAFAVSEEKPAREEAA